MRSLERDGSGVWDQLAYGLQSTMTPDSRWAQVAMREQGAALWKERLALEHELVVVRSPRPGQSREFPQVVSCGTSGVPRRWGSSSDSIR